MSTDVRFTGNDMSGKHWPAWVQIASVVPMGIMLWVLILWTPKTKRQWFYAALMGLYILLYYITFLK
jgi:hypothetical protein